ncbi:MAG: glycosyl hydrolase [Reichenbachiella sp.]|uniref:WD40/YVTN/BNR-like repeat-containing protein n=1 Tax=Reichenbachiella sp. TaxID=2184521 RepID=UPI003297D794
MSKANLLLGTRKGLIIYQQDGDGWSHQSTHFLGIPVSLTLVDERTHTWWACLDHGHWGCKLHRSTDQGKNWEEIEAPKFAEGMEVKEGVPAAVKYLWAMSHGGKDKPGVLYIGTDPGALFKSTDNGDTWQLVESLWKHPSREKWFGGGRDNPGIHSVVVDPRDSNHIYVAVSCAGVFESFDAGETWQSANKGLKADFLPDPSSEIGQDPHILKACPTNPDVLWQQNHCGIFVTTDGAKNWKEVSQKEGPANFGFAVAIKHDNPDQAWVVPGISDEIRVAVDQALVVCRTDDGGKTWKEQRAGLPQENCFDIVYRHCLDISGDSLVFGTTTGNVYYSNDLGENWKQLSSDLPMVYSVEIVV